MTWCGASRFAVKKLTAAGKVGMSSYCLSLLDKLSDLEPHAGDKEGPGAAGPGCWVRGTTGEAKGWKSYWCPRSRASASHHGT